MCWRKKLQLLLLAGKSLTGPRKFENLFPEISRQPLFVLPALDKRVRLRLFLKKIFLLLYLGQQNIENHPTKPKSWLACLHLIHCWKSLGGFVCGWSWWWIVSLGILDVEAFDQSSVLLISRKSSKPFFLRKTYLLQEINMSWLKFGKLVGLVRFGIVWMTLNSTQVVIQFVSDHQQIQMTKNLNHAALILP